MFKIDHTWINNKLSTAKMYNTVVTINITKSICLFTSTHFHAPRMLSKLRYTKQITFHQFICLVRMNYFVILHSSYALNYYEHNLSTVNITIN